MYTSTKGVQVKEPEDLKKLSSNDLVAMCKELTIPLSGRSKKKEDLVEVLTEKMDSMKESLKALKEGRGESARTLALKTCHSTRFDTPHNTSCNTQHAIHHAIHNAIHPAMHRTIRCTIRAYYTHHTFTEQHNAIHLAIHIAYTLRYTWRYAHITRMRHSPAQVQVGHRLAAHRQLRRRRRAAEAREVVWPSQRRASWRPAQAVARLVP